MNVDAQAYTGPVTLWAIAGAALFVVAAVLSERNALFLPAVVLVAAALAGVIA